MKKSKIFIIVSLVLVISMFVSCYLIYNSLFPKAPPIESPHPDAVTSFTVYDYNGNEVSINNTLLFYDFILNAEPTRIMSVNDYPDTVPYYEVTISANDRFYKYFLYNSNGKDYIEISYFGVYEIQNFTIEDLIY